MGLKYIRNTDDATVVCKIPSDKNKVFILKPKKIDKRDGVIISNGFTEVSDEDLELLKKESKTFIYYEKLGRLTITDSLPPESMSSEQLIASLRSEIALLKKEMKSQSKGADFSEDLKAAQTVVEAQKEEIEKLKEELETQSALIDQLNEQIAMTPEAEAEAEKTEEAGQ